MSASGSGSQSGDDLGLDARFDVDLTDSDDGASDPNGSGPQPGATPERAIGGYFAFPMWPHGWPFSREQVALNQQRMLQAVLDEAPELAEDGQEPARQVACDYAMLCNWHGVRNGALRMSGTDPVRGVKPSQIVGFFKVQRMDSFEPPRGIVAYGSTSRRF